MDTAAIKIRRFTDLIVWQKGHQLVLGVYEATLRFPRVEAFCLTSQLRRAAISITSNIAEGFGRRSIPDKRHFYVMAAGSLVEVKNKLVIAGDLRYLPEMEYKYLSSLCEDVHRLLNRLISSLPNP